MLVGSGRASHCFHYFVSGREFITEGDHRVLETLYKKDIDDVVMRKFMVLLQYSGMTITYRPGKEMLVTDYLSRAQLSEEDELEGWSLTIYPALSYRRKTS